MKAAGKKKGEKTDRDLSVPSLTRGMGILELLAKNSAGLGLVEIASGLDIPNNAVFRITGTLVDLGYLHRDEKSRKFILGSKLLSLGLNTVHEVNIVERSLDLMRQLRDDVGEMIALGSILKEEGMGVVLSEIECSFLFGYRLQVGHRWPLHCTGPGKALLAFMPAYEYENIIGRISFKRFTPHTITDRSAFDREMQNVRKDGYALDREEGLIGCHCVAAPIFDSHGYPVAAIWASGPSDRLTAAQFPRVGEIVMRYAGLISQKLKMP